MVKKAYQRRNGMKAAVKNGRKRRKGKSGENEIIGGKSKMAAAKYRERGARWLGITARALAGAGNRGSVCAVRSSRAAARNSGTDSAKRRAGCTPHRARALARAARRAPLYAAA